jgi:hypothetical protein
VFDGTQAEAIELARQAVDDEPDRAKLEVGRRAIADARAILGASHRA